MENTDQSLGSDILVGAEQISKELGFSKRRIYHLVEQGNGFPVRKVKGLGLMARRSSLQKWFDELEVEASLQGKLPFET